MSIKVFEFLDLFLQHVCKNKNPFGGKQIILSMDPLQSISFIQDTELKEIKKCCGIVDECKIKNSCFFSESIIGRDWFYGYLEENNRSKDAEWSNFLSNARISELTEENFQWFQKNSGSAIPFVLKIKWLLINYFINRRVDYGSSDNSFYAFESRLKNGYILGEHHDVYKSILNILELKRIEESKETLTLTNISNVMNIAEVTMLATENVTIQYGDKFNHNIMFKDIGSLTKAIFKSSKTHHYKHLSDSEYEKLWIDDGYKDSVEKIVTDIISCTANNDTTDIIKCQAKDTFVTMYYQKEQIINFDEEEAKYYSDMADKKNKEKNNLEILKGTIVMNKSNSEKYIYSNQRVKVIGEINDTLLVEPLYNNGLISNPRLIKKVLKEFKIAGRGSYKDKTIIVKRRTYPIISNSALMVKSVMGIKLDAALFDNSRGVKEGETYIAAGRVPLPAQFGLLHFPKSLKDLNEKYFKCCPVTKKLDTYLKNQKKERQSCIIPINFKFNYNGDITHI